MARKSNRRGQRLHNVEQSAYVGPNCKIGTKARITGGASVQGHAQVTGSAQVREYGQVKGQAAIHGNAVVKGRAKVEDAAQIVDEATVLGNAKVSGRAVIQSDAVIGGDALVRGEAVIGMSALVTLPSDYVCVSSAGDYPTPITLYRGGQDDPHIQMHGTCHTMDTFKKRMEQYTDNGIPILAFFNTWLAMYDWSLDRDEPKWYPTYNPF